MELEVVQLVDDLLKAARADLDATTLSYLTDVSCLVHLSADDLEVRFDLTDDATHDLACVDAHFDACFAPIM